MTGKSNKAKNKRSSQNSTTTHSSEPVVVAAVVPAAAVASPDVPVKDSSSNVDSSNVVANGVHSVEESTGSEAVEVQSETSTNQSKQAEGRKSTMAMSSLMPSASMERISEWTGESNNKRSVPNRSVSEPNFGRSPRQVCKDFAVLDDYFPCKRMADSSKRVRVPHFLSPQGPDNLKKKKISRPECTMHIQ